MYTAILTAHLIGAAATGVAALYACVAMIVRHEAMYRRLALVLASIASFEIVSGTALAVMSADLTVASVCGNIALYVAAVACVEVVLCMRMKGSLVRFPFMQTAAPFGVSVALLLSGLVLGF